MKHKTEIRLKKNAKITDYSPTQELLDENFIATAIWECLKNNDPDGVMEVIEAHLEAINKVRAAENSSCLGPPCTMLLKERIQL